MERPSHISFGHTHFARRLPLFALAASLQVGAAFLIMTGLGHFKPITDVVLRYIPDAKVPKVDHTPPPPQPTEIKPTLPHAETPIFKSLPEPSGTGIRTSPLPTPPDQPPARIEQPKPPSVPDRAAIGITATHTIPPYPAIALRQNLEGTVLLRLTVLETGRVTKAEVVTSSGSETLDQAAQAWIVAHWAYKPAMTQGQAVGSQTMASVTFNLKNAR